MLFDKKIKPCGYEVVKEGNLDVLKINCNGCPYYPSIEDSEICMSRTIDKLIEVPSTSRIIFSCRRNYEYNYDQTQILIEIANLYKYLVKQKKILSLSLLPQLGNYSDYYRQNLQYIILNLLRSDPIGAYVELVRLIREEKIKRDKTDFVDEVNFRTSYIDILNGLKNLLEETRLIKIVKPYVAGYIIGSRGLYKNVFKPLINPDFMFTRLMGEPPIKSEEIDSYSLDSKTEVNIFKIPGEIQYLYHLNPPEFKISEDKYNVLDTARNALAEHKPRKEEFIDPEKMRRTFFNIGKDLIQELCEHRGLDLSYKEIEELAKILVRYTVGFGLIEVLLEDPKIQDINVNGPIGETKIFVVHEDYGECVTNIIPSREDGESWASKFRILSGRPLDEANPVLDTELILPKARSRVAIIGRPLNPLGLGYAFRRHRDKPWTYPLFIKNKMMNPLAAGLLSFLIDGNRSILFAGTRSSGKTSLLGASLIEIMRRYRIISTEDTLELPIEALRELGYNIQPMKVRSALMSGGNELEASEGIRTSLRMGDSCLIVGEIRSSIRGNEEVLIIEKGVTKKVQIRDLEERDISNIYVPSMDFDLKFKLKKVIAFVKHPKRKKLLEVTTRTGRKITVTPDHSLFTNKDFRIIPIECQSLKEGDKVIIPEKLPLGYNNIKSINILDILKDEGCRVVGYEEDLKQIIKKAGWKQASKICNVNDVYQYLRKGVQHTNIPINSYKELIEETNLCINPLVLQIKKGTSKTLPVNIEINKDFCRFLGYYVAEGYTQENQGNIVFSNGDKLIIDDIINLSRSLFGIDPYIRITKSLGESTQINLHNKILALLIKNLGCGRIALEKRVPPLVYGLSEDKICEFLRGYFDGDGSQTSVRGNGNRISCSTISKGLANDLLYLLLNLGIVARVYTRQKRGIGKNTLYIVEFKQRKYVELFMKKIGFKKYSKKLINRNVSHSNLNTVNYCVDTLEKYVKIKRKYRHLRKYNSCGKEYLKKLVDESEATNLIKTFVNGDFFLDEVKNIKEINLDEGEYVYDLSVEPCQNFIGGFGGILLHNTEALALYEAMRVGSMANVVAGTIHGADPYGVFDRVVNDLKVPRTSFKATDIIVVSNPVRSADGLHRWRRVLQITEVRKHWEEDPLKENGFRDLMKYDVKEDTLKPSDDLLNGDSDVLKAIAGTVKEWSGDWNAVWDNILLRARVKDMLVKYAIKVNKMELLESKFVVASNDIFHRICDSVKEDIGNIDTKRVFFEWEDWLKKSIKRKILVE